MNSIHRVGVTIAGLATAVTVAGAFVVQGYVAAQQAQQQAAHGAAATAAASSAPQVVYVMAPQPTQPPQPAPTPPVIHVVVPGYGDDGGSDRG